MVSFSYTFIDYSAANCGGSVTDSGSGSGTATLAGTKMIDGYLVDKIDIVEDGLTEKQVVTIIGGQLVVGRSAADGGQVDADGYPTTLDYGGALSRQ